MAQNSSIEWTEATWNPTTGCTKVSPGCANCYAERMAIRLEAMGQERYRNAFKLTLQEDIVELPLRWKKPRLIFVNSMSDLFHPKVPAQFIRRCFEVMRQAKHHTFQVLTKRPEKVVEMAGDLPWSDNVWMGTSVENQKYAVRAATLQLVPAAVRFLSIEPILGPIGKLPLDGIHWVIAGGESGPGARPMHPDWVRKVRTNASRHTYRSSSNSGVRSMETEQGVPKRSTAASLTDARGMNSRHRGTEPKPPAVETASPKQ